jgi:predicted ABC-type ATPase
MEKITLDQEVAIERAKKRLLEDRKQIEEDFEKIREEQKRRKEQLQTCTPREN